LPRFEPVTNLLEAGRIGCLTEEPWSEANGVPAIAGQNAESGPISSAKQA
jgi:hypothetical protein